MAQYCDDPKLRRWALGPMECSGDFKSCKRAVQFGNQEYCGFCPSRCTLREVIRMQAGCLGCKNTARKLSSAICAPCLSAPERINYDPNEWAQSLKEGDHAP